MCILVIDIFELSRCVLTRVLEEDLLATWVLVVGHIVDLVFDEEP